MTSMLFDTRRDRSTMFTQLALCCVVALVGIFAYLYSTTLGINYTRERDNIGNTYCMYWMPFENFENSVADQPNAYSCPTFGKPSKPATQS